MIGLEKGRVGLVGEVRRAYHQVDVGLGMDGLSGLRPKTRDVN
jgi:hypothetical protein